MSSGITEGVAIRRLRCPRCRKTPTEAIEHGRWSSSWAISDDGKLRDTEGYHEAGDYTHVTAKCSCGHRWRVRGVMQITGLDLTPNTAPPRGES